MPKRCPPCLALAAALLALLVCGFAAALIWHADKATLPAAGIIELPRIVP